MEIDLIEVIRHVAQAVVILVVPPIMLGLITRTKAVFAGRIGPPVLQPYYDIAKLLRKASIFSRTTTWVFRAGPVIGLVTALLAAALVPIGDGRAIIAFDGDFLVLAYLLGLSRFFTMAAALDTGSAFEGMGAAREATFACLAEPAFILGLLGVARGCSVRGSPTCGRPPVRPSCWSPPDCSSSPSPRTAGSRSTIRTPTSS